MRKRFMERLGAFGLFAAVMALASGARAASCDDLSGLSSDKVAIVEAKSYPAGAFQPEGSAAAAQAFADLPAFCQIKAVAHTSATSSIRITVWLPEAAAWNHRFLVNGWAFFANDLDPAQLTGALKRGYATANTDGGGPGRAADFLLGHPESVKDFAGRAWHQTIVTSKALITALYGAGPRYGYWNGGGGASRQALGEMQRYPGDLDGVVTGGIAGDPVHFIFAQVGEWRAIQGDAHFSPQMLPLLHERALASCDALDGARDGVIADPLHCKVDLQPLLCRAGATDCLTPAQALAVRRLYAPITNPRTGRVIFGGLMPGSELGWRGLLNDPAPSGFAVDVFRNLIFTDASWSPQSLDFDRDLDRAEKAAPLINANDPNLSAFVARGGKLMLWGGWADTAIPPNADVDYFRRVEARLGGRQTEAAARLYMIPGMGHFPGGKGPDAIDFDMQAAMEAWRENGAVPTTIPAKTGDGRSLILCPFPTHAVPARGLPADCR
jgi:feruloyl esterase